MSSHRGRGVNDGIDQQLFCLCYSSIDDALQFITHLGTDTLLLKIDLKNAYSSTNPPPRSPPIGNPLEGLRSTLTKRFHLDYAQHQSSSRQLQMR